MKILKNKELIKIIISFILLITILLFYLCSALLKIIFNKWIVIIGLVVIIGLIITQAIIRNYEKASKVIREINDYMQVLLVAVLIIEIIFTFFAFTATVYQNSMHPTLLPNDQLIIKRTDDLNNNDIIVFRYDNNIQKDNIGVKNNELLIKRVIAVSGQSFEYIGKDLYINGKKAEDKFAVEEMDGLSLKDICALNGLLDECLQEDGTYVIPEGWYVVFGDNRQYSGNVPVSIDSRGFGLVHESQIFGKVIYKLNSLFDWEKIGE